MPPAALTKGLGVSSKLPLPRNRGCPMSLSSGGPRRLNGGAQATILMFALMLGKNILN